MLQTPFNILSIVIVGCAVIIFFLVFFYLLIVQLHRRRIMHEKELLDLKVQYEQVIMQSQLEIQEQTFRNISQEIHDNIGQVLSLAKLNLNTIQASGPTQEQLEITEQLLGKAIADLRDLSKSLNSDKITNLGLVSAIEQELKMIEKSLGIRVDFLYDENELVVSDEQTIVVFRMVQEILNNCIKHAKASVLDVHITTSAGKSCITVKDNGVGFDIHCLNEKETGIGLKSMQRRAELINAHVRIESAPGAGTAVTVCLFPPTNSFTDGTSSFSR